MAAWASDAHLAIPLLGSAVRSAHPSESHIAIDEVPLARRTRQELHLDFPRRLARLLAELRPFHAAALAGLSVMESITVAQGEKTDSHVKKRKVCILCV